jgi:hypothetical protein
MPIIDGATGDSWIPAFALTSLSLGTFIRESEEKSVRALTIRSFRPANRSSCPTNHTLSSFVTYRRFSTAETIQAVPYL